ncbi:hypothetical protein HNP77_001196 [Treponema rectale]|uniref:Uncharacterized protein n=1 Tax=Treponema rectale TaxID=744512 RepID=A0A840SAT1_9SPIR|nr:hypothetical protein [Treponema rectale]MBB5218827.1 hypothetical protein [Treponema rectale]
MKRFFIKSAVFAAVTLSVFSFFSCKDLFNMQIPKSVSVATDAEYNVNLGTMKYSLSDTLSTSAITEQMQESLGNSMQLYNYIQDDAADTEKDESDILSYVLHYPVYEVPVDIGSYLDDLDFDSVFSSADFGFNFDQTISVPSVSGTSTTPIGLDFMDEFKETIDENLSANSFTIDTCYEPGIKQELESNHGSISIVSEAEKIYYKTGSAIEITFEKTDSNACTEGFVFEGMGFLSSDGTSSDLGGSDWVSVKDGGTIEIPLDNAEGLPSEFYVCLKGKSSGGDLGTAHSYKVNIGLADGSDLLRVENIKKHSADFGIDPVDFQMEVSTSEMEGLFNSATISDGNIELSTSPISGWSGVDTEIEFNFAGNTISGSDITDGPSAATTLFDKVADISGTVITPSETPIAIGGTVTVEVYGATIDFTTDVSSLEIAYSYEINSLSDVEIDLTSPKYNNIQTSYSLSTDGTGSCIELTDQLTKYVKSITFGEQSGTSYYKHNSSGNLDNTIPAEGLGFKFTLVNTLDTDDLTINVNSNIMNYHLTKNLSTTSDSGESQTWVQYPEVDFTALNTSQKNYVDFTFEFANTTITLNSITLGQDYKLSLAFEKMLYDWDSVTLNSDGTSVDGENSLESFDLSSLLDGLSLDEESIKNINIATLPVFFYAQKPTSTDDSLSDILNALHLSGKISIDYTTTDSSGNTQNDSVYVLGSESSGENLNFMTDTVPWPADISTIIASDETAAALAAEGKVFDSEVLPYLNEANADKYSFTTDLADIINAYPETMNFKYSLALGGTNSDTVIYSQMLSNISSGGSGSESTVSDTSIKIDMAIILSFNLELKGDIVVDIMSFYKDDWATSDEDLLSRDSASTYEKYAEYCDAIDSFAMYYRIDNEVFNGLDFKAGIDDSYTGIQKEIDLSEGKLNTLSFSSREIEKILTTYPFHPSVTMTLTGGTESSPKDLTMSRKQMDSEDGAYLGASVKLKLDLSNRAYIKIWGED